MSVDAGNCTIVTSPTVQLPVVGALSSTTIAAVIVVAIVGALVAAVIVARALRARRA